MLEQVGFDTYSISGLIATDRRLAGGAAETYLGSISSSER